MIRYFVIIFVFLLIQPIFADDVLDILDSDKISDSVVDIKKRNQLFRSLVRQPAAEQNIFFQFIEKKEFKKALYQWSSAFYETSFANSNNGRALYAYLLFKNGLQITGLETLFMADPEKINEGLIGLWQETMLENQGLWAIANIRWSPSWTKVFGLSVEVKVLAHRFDNEPDLAMLEDLLRKTSSNTWERSWIQWRYIIFLLMQDKDIKAAKLLKHLQMATVNNPISQDLMNLTAARTLYKNGYLAQSLNYYKKVTKASDYWFEAMEEMGWTELRLGKPQNVLAYTQTLLNPVFSSDVGPETFYLASLGYLKICDYQGVSKTLKDFQIRFRARIKTLLGLRENPEGPSVKKLFSELREGRVSMSSLGNFGNQLPRYSTRDEHLYFLVQRQKQLILETEVAKKLYSQSLGEGTTIVGFQAKMEKFRNKVAASSQNAYVAALNRVKTLADQEIAEVSETLKKMKVVEAELIQQLSLAKRVMEDTKDLKSEAKKGTTGSKGNYTMSFPYDGEVWFDELSNYRIHINKSCHANKKAL